MYMFNKYLNLQAKNFFKKINFHLYHLYPKVAIKMCKSKYHVTNRECIVLHNRKTRSDQWAHQEHSKTQFDIDIVKLVSQSRKGRGT